MQKAIWNGTEVIALDAIGNTAFKNELKAAGKNNRLFCPHTGCTSPHLILKCGEIRIPHFAHKLPYDCTYSLAYKKTPKRIKIIRNSIYNILKEKGHIVSIDNEIIKDHLTLLTCETENKIIAIEIFDKKAILDNICRIAYEYADKGIEMAWIFVTNDGPTCINPLYFIRNYPIDLSNSTFFLTDKYGEAVIQYSFKDHLNVLQKIDDISNINIENNSLNLENFQNNHNNISFDDLAEELSSMMKEKNYKNIYRGNWIFG